VAKVVVRAEASLMSQHADSGIGYGQDGRPGQDDSVIELDHVRSDE
jgi:hypothetical protein